MGARGERKLKYEKPSPVRMDPTGISMYAQMAGGAAKSIGGMLQYKKKKGDMNSANAAYEQQRSNYLDFEFKNPYENMTNKFEGLENTMEDLTVNQKQAQFERQTQAQGMADVMQGMQGAAGGSGIAGLAQAMASQQAKNSQAAAASIGQQESKNRMATAAQASQLQQQEAKYGISVDKFKAEGAEKKQNLELERTENLFTEAGANKVAAKQAMQANTDAILGGVGELAGGAMEFSQTPKGAEMFKTAGDAIKGLY